MLTVTECIDRAFTTVLDNSSDFREKAVSWLNEVVREILDEPREWFFLKQGVELSIDNGTATIPEGVGEILGFQFNDRFLDKDNQLSDEQATYARETLEGASYPAGYILSGDGATVEFIPAITGTCTLHYEVDDDATYAEGDTTIFPLRCRQVFIWGLRRIAYFNDKDGRYSAAEAMYDEEMKRLKAWDNNLKPIPPLNRHGFIRA